MEKETASFWAGIKKFEDILARDPNAYSFAPLAEIYRKLSLPDEALRIARKGVSLHPEFVAGQMALASSCLDKALVDEARQALEVVVRITPENLEAQRVLADLYLSAGNVAAADFCLRIVASLDPLLVEEPSATAESSVEAAQAATVSVPLVAVEKDVAAEEEILELTDDLIEVDVFDEEPYTPFAAAPERPSLLAAREKLEMPAPQPERQLEGEAEESAAPSTVATEEVQQPSVLTATIAELYVSQGLLGKGLEVYRELLREAPDNVAYKERYLELSGDTPSAPVSASVTSTVDQVVESSVLHPEQSAQGPVETLEGWLGNIRRIRECRTEMR